MTAEITEKEITDAMAIFSLPRGLVKMSHIDFVRFHDKTVERCKAANARLKNEIQTWENML